MKIIIVRWAAKDCTKEILVDDDMYEYLSAFNWHMLPNGHSASAWIPGTKIRMLMHHAVIGKPINNLVVDHIDRNSLNNQRCNLRVVTNQENSYNSGPRKGRYKGVCMDKSENKFMVRAGNKSLGRFTSENEAAAEYNAYVYLTYGEVAFLNYHPANDAGFETFPSAEDITLLPRPIKPRLDNTSGHIGVAPGHRQGIWRAYHTTRGKTTQLGWYTSKEEAIAVREIYVKGLHRAKLG